MKGNAVYRSLRILTKKELAKLMSISAIQISFGFLDLVGVALIGVLGALSVSGVQSKNPTGRVFEVLSFFQIEKLTFQNQVAILGFLAVGVLILKTFLSIIFTRRILHFLSQRSSAITSRLLYKFFNQKLTEIQTLSSQENLYSMTVGVQSVTVGLIGSSVVLISDFSMLLILLIGLFVVDVYLALSTVALFSTIALLLYIFMQKKANFLGTKSSELTIESNAGILELIESFREISIRNRTEFYTRKISKVRQDLAYVNAEMMFMPNVSKYVIETALVVGAIVIGGVQFATQDATNAIAALSVFFAAGSRIAPGVLRIQQGLIQIKSSVGIAEPTLVLIEKLAPLSPLTAVSDNPNIDHLGFSGDLKIIGASLTYPNREFEALCEIDLVVKEGTTLAVVGPSGAGKTSLVDLMLGLISPSKGEIQISGLKPTQAITKWPGAIAYVPQNIAILNSSVRENISLGYPAGYVSEDQIVEALRFAHLEELLENLEDGLDSRVGDKGLKISGGQRQRLGIARAVFTNPRFLVLDEATSALDAQTEAAIADSINHMKGKVTLIIVAHRLSTVQNADLVIYMDKGKIVARGSFTEVRNLVPNFDSQAKLMGL
jgi:ABC-type multidrug transport system fused ATPase/permease subunit